MTGYTLTGTAASFLGLWPNAGNTGVQSGITLTAYTGPTLVTTDGTLIENKIIADTLEIQADGVTIRNCRVEDSGLHGIFGDTATNVTIEYCDIIGDGGTSVATGILTSGTFTANDISGFALGISPTGPATIRDNYIHDLTKTGPDVHFDGIALFGGQDGVLIEHNAIYVPSVGGTGNIFLKNAFGPINNVTISNNLLRGGPGYTIPMDSNTVGSSITNVSVINNVMEVGGFDYFSVDGPNFSNVTGSGNVDYLTGATVPFPDVGGIDTLTAAGGSYVLTGTAAALRMPQVFPASGGSYTLTGSAATFVTSGNFVLAAVVGSHALTGADAAFRTATATGYALTGQGAALRLTHVVGASNYTLTGGAVTFPAGATVVAGAGAYALSGSPASFIGIMVPAQPEPVPPSVGSYTGGAGRGRMIRRRKREDELGIEEAALAPVDLPPPALVPGPPPLLPPQPGLMADMPPIRRYELPASPPDEDEDEVALLLELLS